MNYNKDPGGLVPNPVAVKVSFCLYAPFDHLNKDLFFPLLLLLLDPVCCLSEVRMLLCRNQTIYP